MESRGMRMRVAAIAFVIALLWSGACASAGSIAIYWGQHTEEASLGETCESGNFEIVVLSYLLINGTTGNENSPELNVAGHTDPLNAEIKYCQSIGVKVFLSLDGAVASAEHAQELASYLWDNFLGGESESRPLGDAAFDGIDFGIQFTNANWDALAKEVSNLSTCCDKVYLSASPQCPIPDYYLDTALKTGLFDYVWIKFYNNPDCQYANGDASKLVSSWNKWTTTFTAQSFYLGLAAGEEDAYSGGYIEPEILVSDVLPLVKDSPKYGGVMLSSKYLDEKTNYSSIIRDSVIRKPSFIRMPTVASV